MEIRAAKDAVARVVKRIELAINNGITEECTNVTEIKQCRDTELPLVQKDYTACDAALVKYARYSSADLSYYLYVTDVLHQADVWMSMVKTLYVTQQVHSIRDAKFDAADVGVFLDNSERSIYEFF